MPIERAREECPSGHSLGAQASLVRFESDCVDRPALTEAARRCQGRKGSTGLPSSTCPAHQADVLPGSRAVRLASCWSKGRASPRENDASHTEDCLTPAPNSLGGGAALRNLGSFERMSLAGVISRKGSCHPALLHPHTCLTPPPPLTSDSLGKNNRAWGLPWWSIG